jgi:hypothetical protein
MRTWVGLAALAAVGCMGSPEDAFVGRYDGTYECNGMLDGAPYTEGPLSQTIDIQQYSDGRVFIAGRLCTQPLRVLSVTRAEYVPSSCSATLDNGTRVVATVESGIVQLDEPRLAYEVNFLIEPVDGTGILTAHCSFSGFRLE